MYLRSILLLCCMTPFLACKTTSSTSSSQAKTIEPAPAPVEPAPQKSDAPLRVTMRVQAMKRGADAPVFINSNDRLRNGDKVALNLKVSEPAYVYLGLADPNGGQELLYPKPGQDKLFQPDVETRIPDKGSWYSLVRDIGQEDLFVYVSREPIEYSKLLELLKGDTAKVKVSAPKTMKSVNTGRKGTGGQPARPASKPNEQLLARNDRTLMIVSDEGEEIEGEKGQDMMMVHFLIHHEK